MITSRILADSISAAGHRCTTYELTYPRFIHAQVLTHRVFSRNAQSMRAERIETVRSRVIAAPVRPLEWRYSQRGMVPGELMTRRHAGACRVLWDRCMWDTLAQTKDLVNFDASKEIVNRLLAPFSTITTLLTGTNFDNFFELRCNHDTQVEMRTLAYSMKEQYENSEPRLCDYSMYHNPFADTLDRSMGRNDALKVAIARCARVSYGTHSGTHSTEADLKLYERLLSSKHMSPFEHVARPIGRNEHALERNLIGWVTHRTEVENAR